MRSAFPGGPGIDPVDWADAAEEVGRAAAVLNATSVGLAGNSGTLPPFQLRADQLAVDFVYGDTPFARQARAAGASFITGEQILVRQGALAFTLWTGQPAPEAAMTAALSAAPRTS
jgi:shikimate dehydrogenase